MVDIFKLNDPISVLKIKSRTIFVVIISITDESADYFQKVIVKSVTCKNNEKCNFRESIIFKLLLLSNQHSNVWHF